MNTLIGTPLTNAEILRDYIIAHGIEAHELNGHLFAHNWSAKDGERFMEVVELEPTVSAVREWLGY